MNSVADVWNNVLQQLKGELSETTIATWFDELEAVDIRGNTFLLHCSNDFKKGYIESLFMKNIKASLHDIFSTDFEVQILDDQAFAEFNGGEKLGALVSAGKLNLAPLSTHVFEGWEHLEEALFLMRDKPADLIKPVVKVGD